MAKSTKRIGFGSSLLAAAMCASWTSAHAAGLGKMAVLSPLGQPLRAEVEILASPQELALMNARLASAEAFKDAGIEYLPSMAGIRFAIDKHKDGQAYLRMTTVRPVNDPFLDILVELTWSSGRVVREYTLLLDPPEIVKKATPVPVAVPEAKRPPAAETAAARPVAAPSAPRVVEVERAGESIVVKKGDTLAKIAAATKPEDVSLDQMLVALFRHNEAAFDGGNMNRLRAGKILAVPDAASVAGVAPGEAGKIVIAQSRDFEAYRRRLASVIAAAPVAGRDVARQAAAGRIAPKPEEKPPAPAAGRDKLEVSRTEAAKGDKALHGRIVALEEDLISRDRALKEASTRLAQLEKNLADLKKLTEMRGPGGAQAPQETQAARPAEQPKPAAKAAEAAVETPSKPVEATKPPPAAPTTDAAKPQEAPKPKKAPEAAKPPTKKPVVATPPPPPEPSFIEENAPLVYGGGGLLALLFGYLGFKSWKRRKEGGGEGVATTSRLSEGELMANSVFGSTGGQAVDTSGSSIQTDFSQPSLTAIDADEGVDPVAEADVYMAYGRDAQAEEILLDALKSDPARRAIHLKLLEIYSARKNVRQFEAVATDLRAQTQGIGPDWEKAAAMGRLLDSGNPLYASSAPEVEPSALSAAMPEGAPETLAEVGETGVTEEPLAVLPGIAAIVPESLRTEEEVEEVQAPPLDIDLGVPIEPMAAAAPESAPTIPEALDFDIDFGKPVAEVPAPLVAAAEEAASLDIDLMLPEAAAPAEAAPAVPVAEEAIEAGVEGMDFEFDLQVPSSAEGAAVGGGAKQLPPFDLSGIDLDLGVPLTMPAGAELAAPEGEEDNSDIATKLELAEAYEEMGDKEGARELLQEVVHEGSAHQQELARAKLAALDA